VVDTIDVYLNSLFAPYVPSAQIIEARMELRAMMDDAYNEAIGREVRRKKPMPDTCCPT
jgi:hypothetical protein